MIAGADGRIAERAGTRGADGAGTGGAGANGAGQNRMTSAINHQDVHPPAMSAFELFCVAYWNASEDDFQMVGDLFAGAAQYAARFGDPAHVGDLRTCANLADARAELE